MRRYDAVIFDWGNTLCDYPLGGESEQLAFLDRFLADPQTFHDTAQAAPPRVGADVLTLFNRERADGRVVPFTQRLRTLCIADLSEDDGRVIEQRLCTRIFAHAALIDGAEAAVEAVRAAGMAVAILSNTPWGTSSMSWRAEVSRHAAVSRHCSHVIFCADSGFRKPADAAFRLCLDRLQAAPGRVLMVGDNLASDVSGARAAGCDAVWFSQARMAGVVSISRLSDVAQVLD